MLRLSISRATTFIVLNMRRQTDSCKMAERVTMKVSGVAPGTSEERIKGFFEEKGENISVGALSSLVDGTVVVELIGITDTELEMLLAGNHKLSKRLIQLEIVSSELAVAEIKCDSVSSLIEVHGVSGFEKEDLELYFETAKAGGRKGSIKSCTIEPNGIARIEFDNPEAVAGIMSITNHSLFGAPLKVTYPSSPGQQASPGPSKIWLTEVPSSLISEMDYLRLLIERIVGEELPFSITQVNGTTLLLEFSEDVHLSEGELTQIADKIGKKQMKGATLKPTLTMAAPSPIVSGMTMVKSKSKLLVTTSEDIDLDHLSLLLEKAMNMEIDKDFSVSLVGSRNYLVIIERKLSEEEAEHLIKTIETKPLKIQIKATYIDCCQLLLSELPSIEMAHLELLIEKLIGQEKGFTLEKLEHSRALLEFKRSMPDEELAIVVATITNTKVKGATIKVQKLEIPYMAMASSSSSPCRLRVSGIPSIDLDHLGLLIERAAQLECNLDFLLEQKDEDSFLMTCKKHLSEKELESLLTALMKVEVKGVHLKVEKWKEEVKSVPNVLLISGVPPNCELDHLGLALEKSLHMEMKEHFILSAHDDLSALITFKKCLSSQDLDEVILKINKTALKGKNLKAAVFITKEVATSSEDPSSLLLEGIPDNSDEEYLVVVLSKAMGIEDSEFSVKCLGNCAALLTFKKRLSDSALEDRIRKIGMKQLKGKFIKAISWKSTPCIYIRNITEHYNEEFLKNYFENTKRSGGDEVVSVDLFGNGEAKVMFKDIKVMKNVIQLQHQESLGNDVIVTQDNPLEKFSGSKPEPTLQNVKINVRPEIVDALQREQANWSRLLSNLHVNASVDVQQAAIIITQSKHTPAGWMNCASVLSKYIDNNFATKDLPISKAAALDIIKLLQSKKEIMHSTSDDFTTLRLMGNPNLLVQIENQVNEILASVAIIEKQLTLDPEDYAFISQIKQREMSVTAPDVKVDFTAPNSISLNGPARNVKKLEESIIRLSVHSSVIMVMESLLKEFACTNDGCEQIRSYICASQETSAAICIKGSGSTCTLVVLCSPDIVGNVKTAVSHAQKELHIEIVPLSSKCHAKLSEQNISRDYRDVCEQLQKKDGVLIKRSSDCICIAGFKDRVKQTLSALNEFIKTNCKVTSSATIETGMWRLFQNHMKSEWDGLVRGIKGIDVTTRSEKKSISITVCGQIDQVDEMCELLSSLQKKVFKKDVHPPSYTTGFSEYEKSNDWSVFHSGAESLHKVSIAVLRSERFAESSVIPAEVAEVRDVNNTKMLSSILPGVKHDEDSLPRPQSMVWTASNLKCVTIHKGSLLDVKADVYVNSTNTNLDLSGGVISKYLATAAGPSLQDECTKKAPINPGQVAVTGSGNMKCKYIFHIALNTYDGPGGSAEKVLKKSMDNCLDECRQQKVASIAFPALGTGVLNFPPQVAANIMMESVATVKDLTGINIHFVIFVDTVHKAFEEMKAFLEGRASYPSITEAKIASQPSIPQSQRHLSSTMHKRSPKKLDMGSYQSSLKDMLSNKFSINSVTVEIVQGDLTDQSTDVIVNSTGSDMKNTSGVSGAILKKGGSELIKACEAYIAQMNQLHTGKVAITPASGSLRSKCVFHINVNPAQLQSAVITCLKEADSQKYHSISFPAIATGNHKSSADRVAHEMYKAFHQYALQNPQHTTRISVVIFQLELLDPFLKAFQHLCSDKPALSSDDDISSSYTNVSNSDDVTSIENNTTSFWFRIFGADESAVKRAAGVLDEHLSKTFVCDRINNIIVKPSADVHQLCKVKYVTLTYDPTANTITLSGRKCEVDVVGRKIENEKAEQEKIVSLKREAELLHKHVQWQHQTSDSSFVPYTAEVNLQIEKAFQAKKQTYNHDDPSDPFSIDFNAYNETKPNSKSPSVNVIREDLLARYRGDAPKEWEKMPIDTQTKTEYMYQLFDLKTDSKEFLAVQQKFAATVNAKKIISIQRVQNTMLYGQYIARKNAMEKLNPPGTNNESSLFHGTSVDTIPKINSQGFNRTFAGKNATAYGIGVYFAVNASYSAHQTYSPPDANGHKYMYLVRVLTGEFTIGNSTMIVPPAKNPTMNPNVLFDSLVDRSPNPSMFIIFQDAQAYPEYLITFAI